MAIQNFGGTRNVLPNKWCVLRTPANAQVVNGYLNQKHGYNNYYSKDEQKYVTSDTKKGGVAPTTKQPAGFALLTYEEFVVMVVNENGGIPKYWAVKGDGSAQFLTIVIPYFNSLRTPANNVTGTSLGYYGFDGEARVCNDVQGFSRAVSVLSIEEFITAVRGNNQGVVPGRAQPALAPAPGREPETVDYRLIQAYPGYKVIGTLASTVGINDPALNAEPDYWQPIQAILYYAGNSVVIVNGEGQGLGIPNGSIYSVIRSTKNGVNPAQNGYQNLYVDTVNGGKYIASGRVRLATPEEVNAQVYPVVANVRCIPTQNGTINIGNARDFDLPTINKIKSLIEGNPGSVITIGNTDLNVEVLESLAEQLDE